MELDENQSQSRKKELKEHLFYINSQIASSCSQAGRERSEITLIAVSKTYPAEDILLAMENGQTCFGENRVQELLQKQEVITQPLEWHLIGHLQTNKVKSIIGKTALIHSVDSLHLAEVIEQESAKKNVITEILLEINAAQEASKFGFSIEETETMVRQIALFPHVRIRGLMTVAPATDDPDSNRIHFKKMRKLFLDIASKKVDNVCMDVLSMGMSGDFQIAIEEGATCIRVGTGIFGARDYTMKK